MTEHPAAPTTEAGQSFLRWMADRELWHPIDGRRDVTTGYLLVVEAEARAAARKEVIAIIEALPIMAAQHSCWDDHEGGTNGPHADGTPCRDRVLWEAVDRRAILDSLSTDTREEPSDAD